MKNECCCPRAQLTFQVLTLLQIYTCMIIAINWAIPPIPQMYWMLDHHAVLLSHIKLLLIGKCCSVQSSSSIMSYMRGWKNSLPLTHCGFGDIDLVNITSDNGLLSEDTKPLRALLLTYHHWGFRGTHLSNFIVSAQATILYVSCKFWKPNNTFEIIASGQWLKLPTTTHILIRS